MPQKRINRGMIPRVWIAPSTSHQTSGSRVNQFQTIKGHARMNPYARQYSRPWPDTCSETGKS